MDPTDNRFNELLNELSKAVRAIREQKELSVEELAERSGLHRTHIYGIERVKGNVTLKSLYKLAAALDVQLPDLLQKAEHAIKARTPESYAKIRAKILIIEDHPADVFLIKRCLSKAFVNCNLDVISDAEQVMDHLRTKRKSTGDLPALILLDLNLPKLDGHEILSFIKSDSSLQHVPVVILTSSVHRKDLELSYKLHANSYVTKSSNSEQFARDLESIVHYWCSTSQTLV